MRMITKVLALIPLAALVAACNGVSPTTSTPLADEGLATAPSASVESKDADVSGCRDIIGVNLEVMPATRAGVVIHATYVRFGGVAVRCANPIWSSDPRGALVTNQLNGFRVGVKPMRPVTVTAMAPNGVKGSVTLPAATDLEASAVCQNVKGVQVKIVPSTLPGKVLLEATYLQFGPSLGKCAAPAWTSVPRGILTGTKNPFQVRVGAARPANVVATAPNGLRGEITLDQK